MSEDAQLKDDLRPHQEILEAGNLGGDRDTKSSSTEGPDSSPHSNTSSPLGDIIYWAKEQSGFCNRYCTVHILASLENIFTSGDYKLTSIFPSDDYTATNSLV